MKNQHQFHHNKKHDLFKESYITLSDSEKSESSFSDETEKNELMNTKEQNNNEKTCQPDGCLRNYCKDAERDNSDCSCNINNCRAVWIYVLYGNFCNTAGS